MLHDTGGRTRPAGRLAATVTRDHGELGSRHDAPARWTIANWIRNRRRAILRDVAIAHVGRVLGCQVVESALSLATLSRDPRVVTPESARRILELLERGVPAAWLLPHFRGLTLTEFGVVGTRVITTAGVNYLVDAFQGTVEPEDFKFHGFGTGTAAEATSDTTLGTELTTEYTVDGTRPTGTQGEGASSNIYRTTATLSPDSGTNPLAITEHGLFSAASAGVLWDRTKFAAVNLVPASDSLQAQYDLTASAGG